MIEEMFVISKLNNHGETIYLDKDENGWVVDALDALLYDDKYLALSKYFKLKSGSDTIKLHKVSVQINEVAVDVSTIPISTHRDSNFDEHAL